VYVGGDSGVLRVGRSKPLDPQKFRDFTAPGVERSLLRECKGGAPVTMKKLLGTLVLGLVAVAAVPTVAKAAYRGGYGYSYGHGYSHGYYNHAVPRYGYGYGYSHYYRPYYYHPHYYRPYYAYPYRPYYGYGYYAPYPYYGYAPFYGGSFYYNGHPHFSVHIGF
jgi:hypothetical protein